MGRYWAGVMMECFIGHTVRGGRLEDRTENGYAMGTKNEVRACTKIE